MIRVRPFGDGIVRSCCMGNWGLGFRAASVDLLKFILLFSLTCGSGVFLVYLYCYCLFWLSRPWDEKVRSVFWRRGRY